MQQQNEQKSDGTADQTQSDVSATITPVATPNRQPQRRRVRRKGSSQQDEQAEHLTEMSVRGLNLFRYAKIFEGIYQCTECAKENIQKTFKNKYSFQRHAFLYHEGTSRKVFPCPVCSKEFSRPDKMKNHMKTTHDVLPTQKEAVYPLSFLAGSGGEMPSAQSTPQVTTQKQTKPPAVRQQQALTAAAQEQKLSDTQNEKQSTTNNLRIENVMSAGFTVDATPQIKIEVSD